MRFPEDDPITTGKPGLRSGSVPGGVVAPDAVATALGEGVTEASVSIVVGEGAGVGLLGPSVCVVDNPTVWGGSSTIVGELVAVGSSIGWVTRLSQAPRVTSSAKHPSSIMVFLLDCDTSFMMLS